MSRAARFSPPTPLRAFSGWLLAALVSSRCLSYAGPGPGITQATFLPSEVGTEVFNFSNSVVGAQPTVADFQHGYLVINAAHSLDGTQSGRVSWFNFSNPRSPSLITQVTTGGNKPTTQCFRVTGS